MKKERDEHWMREALREAGEAFAREEIPVGAVIVLGDECLSRASDLRETTGDPTAHAEILAIREAARKIGDWRLEGCEIFVTLEPCPMCAGAMILSRLKRLVYGAPNHKSGAIDTHCRLLEIDSFNHFVEVRSGVLEKECAELLKRFFSGRR